MNETCRPKLKLAHQAWLDEMQETYGAAQTLMRAATKRMSGYAVNLADADAHALALIQVEQYERAVYARLLQWAQHWTHSAELYSDHCVEPLDPPTTAPAPGAPDVESEAPAAPAEGDERRLRARPDQAQDLLRAIQQSFKEEVIPWVQAYAEVSYNFRSGRLSVFGGIKGEVYAGVGKSASSPASTSAPSATASWTPAGGSARARPSAPARSSSRSSRTRSTSRS